MSTHLIHQLPTIQGKKALIRKAEVELVAVKAAYEAQAKKMRDLETHISSLKKLLAFQEKEIAGNTVKQEQETDKKAKVVVKDENETVKQEDGEYYYRYGDV